MHFLDSKYVKKCVCSESSTLNPHVIAYSVLPDTLAGFSRKLQRVMRTENEAKKGVGENTWK